MHLLTRSVCVNLCIAFLLEHKLEFDSHLLPGADRQCKKRVQDMWVESFLNNQQFKKMKCLLLVLSAFTFIFCTLIQIYLKVNSKLDALCWLMPCVLPIGWMYNLQFYVLFNSVTVIPGRCGGWRYYDTIMMMKDCVIGTPCTVWKISASGNRTRDHKVSRPAFNPLS